MLEGFVTKYFCVQLGRFVDRIKHVFNFKMIAVGCNRNIGNQIPGSTSCCPDSSKALLSDWPVCHLETKI